jgi:uncharacterized protein
VDILHIVISLLAGIVAGFIGAITGGAAILSIPALLFLGLPANAAIATNSLAILGVLTSATPQYYKAKKIRWNSGIKLVPIAILGGFIGSKALVHFDVSALSIVIAVLLLLLIPVIFLNPDKGLKSYKESSSRTVLGYFVYFLVTVYGGFLAAGAGAFAMYTLIFFLGMTYLEAKGTTFVPGIFLSVTALVVFLAHGLVDFRLGIPMLVGMFIGAMLGAETALEKGNAWVRIIFIGVIIAASIKLLFFS